jgi:hypothetical protein
MIAASPMDAHVRAISRQAGIVCDEAQDTGDGCRRNKENAAKAGALAAFHFQRTEAFTSSCRPASWLSPCQQTWRPSPFSSSQP